MPELRYAAERLHRDLRLRSLDEALAELQRLRQAPEIILSPGWDLPHVLDHCTRAIEYAMAGFPEQRHAVFQALIGKTAFRVFDWKGAMRHNLSEEIPGSAPTPAVQDLDTAMALLLDRIRLFQQFDGPLQPHFTYGLLTKAQYERANAMHIANHLSVMQF